MNPTYAQYLADDGLKARLVRRAHHEQAAAVSRAIAQISFLFSQLGRIRHAPRPHLVAPR